MVEKVESSSNSAKTSLTMRERTTTKKLQHQQEQQQHQTHHPHHPSPSGLVHISQVPHWLQFNPYIHESYRVSPMQPKECFATLWKWHNETINVWTHFLGGLLCLYICGCEAYRWWISGLACVWCEKQAMIEHGGGAASLNIMICSFALAISFFGSTSYHLFMPCCCSQAGYTHLLACDVRTSVVGIAITAITFLLKGNPCASNSERGFIVLVFVTLAIATILLGARSRNVKQRMIGIGIFVALRFSCAVICLTPKANNYNRFAALFWGIFSFLFMVLGGWFNMSRVPEKWFPGKLDNIFNSHNIWHCLSGMSGLMQLLEAQEDDRDWLEILCVNSAE